MGHHDIGGASEPGAGVPGIERRVAPRIELHVGVGFHSDTNFYTGFTEDISEGGLFIATHVLRPIGTVLQVTFALPTGDEITSDCVVRWLRDPHQHSDDAVPGMGVQFLGLDEAQEALIREFVSVREPLFFDA